MKIEVKKNILARNSAIAAANRARLGSHDVAMINLMASPGAGKTSIIMAAIEGAGGSLSIAVIEGDIASEIDSLAIEQLGIPALQINTGGSCHLTAAMIDQALDHLDLDSLDLIIIENVGNLVCPAEFDLGESGRVVVSSITEGDDKPLKYPAIFRVADAILINKTDLVPYCDFDVPAFHQTVRSLNPQAAVFELSCTTGEGVASWCGWLESLASPVGTGVAPGPGSNAAPADH